MEWNSEMLHLRDFLKIWEFLNTVTLTAHISNANMLHVLILLRFEDIN